VRHEFAPRTKAREKAAFTLVAVMLCGATVACGPAAPSGKGAGTTTETTTLTGKSTLFGSWGTAASPITSAANVWVSPSGSNSTCRRTSAPRAPASPCSTFQRAYQIANLGDTVGIQDGAYGVQTLTDVAGKTGTSDAADVTFTPEHANGVTVEQLRFGDDHGANNGADHVTINGVRSDEVGGTLTHPCGWTIQRGSYDVTLSYIHTCDIYVQGAVDATIQHSELGPCVLTTSQYCNNNFTDSSALPPQTSNVAWRNVTFHDYSAGPDSPNAHLQCMFVLTAVTIENSRFYHCAVFDIFFQANAGTASDPFDGTLIQNNWFAAPRLGTYGDECCRTTAISLPPASQYGNNITIRYNSFYKSQPYWGDEQGTGNISVANIFLDSYGNDGNCVASGINAHNIYVGSRARTCGGVGEKSVASWPYVSASIDSDLDYRLSRSRTSTAADDSVPCATGPTSLGFDYDGQTRWRGTNCDAGSDERVLPAFWPRVFSRLGLVVAKWTR
jgi:hypothetical protein